MAQEVLLRTQLPAFSFQIPAQHAWPRHSSRAVLPNQKKASYSSLSEEGPLSTHGGECANKFTWEERQSSGACRTCN